MNAKLISEEEGASLVGVTEQTIREYARFGFLNPVQEGEKIFYKEIEIKRLFGEESSTEEPVKKEAIQETPVEETIKASPVEISEPETTAEKISTATFVSDAEPHQNGYELLALNRRMREEIQQLRDEREWLRVRLEKLEERSERDQMLLLSDMQTIRTLVNKPEKKSFWARALPWFQE